MFNFWANPLDNLLKKAQKKEHKRFLLTWNRGFGDVALGIYAIIHRIRLFIPDATITFLVRADLQSAFSLLQNVEIISCPFWKRGTPFHLKKTLQEMHIDKQSFDVIIENPNPTKWCQWQFKTLVPKLEWNDAYDKRWEKFDLDPNHKYYGMHVHAETHYGYQKNWPLSNFRKLAEEIVKEENSYVLLFGFAQTPGFNHEKIIDLRGKTELLDLLSIVKNCCTALIVPDSGILSLSYYLNARFALKIVSLWADPRQGVLKQNVASPNCDLIHIPLLGSQEDISTIELSDVMRALNL